MIDGKGVRDILAAIFSGQQGLFGCVPDAYNMGSIHLHTDDPADTPRDIFRLVIASFSQACRVERYGYDHIYSVKESRILHFYSRLTPEKITDIRLIGIFHLMDSPLDRMVFFKEKEGRRFIQAGQVRLPDEIVRFSQNGGFGEVLPIDRLFRPRQRTYALRAKYGIPAFADIAPAYRANARVDEFQEGMQHSHRGTRIQICRKGSVFFAYMQEETEKAQDFCAFSLFEVVSRWSLVV